MEYRAAPPDAPLLVFSTLVTALDRKTGAQRWQYDMKEVTRRFLIDGDRVFVFDSKSVLHCLAVTTGQLIGQVALGLVEPGNLLFDEGVLYVSGDDGVAALDREGRLLWRTAVAANKSWSLVGLGVPGGNVAQPDFSRAP